MNNLIFIKNSFHKTRRIFAKTWLDINLQLKIVGVTGSYGKTTAVRAISEVLSAKYKTIQTDINLDTNFNLPKTLLKIKPWTEAIVLEYGIDHLGEMDEHLKLVRPQIAVLTGITPVHTDETHFKSLNNLINEKKSLVDSVAKDGLAVFNYDDEEVFKIGSKHPGSKIFYGLSKKADIWADNINIGIKETSFELHEGKENIKVITGLLGYPAVYACLVGWTVGKTLGVNKEQIIGMLSKLSPLPGRLSVEIGPLDTILVNDTKRANPASVLAGLKTIQKFTGRRIIVLGEMGELGESEEKMHRLIGKSFSGMNVDTVVGVGNLTKFIIEEIGLCNTKIKTHWTKDVKEAAQLLKKILEPKDILYLKASLLRHLERILLILNNKKVECGVVSCNRYKQCDSCPLLEKKLN